MKLKQFQREDLARAALHDGLILGLDTGLGKTICAYVCRLRNAATASPPRELADTGAYLAAVRTDMALHDEPAVWRPAEAGLR